jgi:hypothetical protein
MNYPRLCWTAVSVLVAGGVTCAHGYTLAQRGYPERFMERSPVFYADAPTEALGRDDVSFTADQVEMMEEGVFYGRTNVVIRYQDVVLYADEVSYDSNTKIVRVPGWGRVVHRNYEVIGRNAIYNLETEAGQFEDAHAIANFGPFMHEGRWYERKWYAYGKKVTKDPGETAFHIKDGKATTCPPEYRHPLYHVEAKNLSILPVDESDPTAVARIVARNAAIKLEGIPILWLPQLTYTVRDEDQQSPIQVKAGYSSQKGAFVVGAIDVFRNKNLRITPHVGFYSEHGVSWGVDGAYNYRYRDITSFSGTWKTFFLEDFSRQFILGSPSDDEEEGDRMWRYRFLWEHGQTFGPGAGWLRNGVLLWQVDLLSDIDLIQEFYRDDYRHYGERPTFIDFTKPIGPDNEVSLYAVKQVNDFYTTLERLPEVRHVFRKRRVVNIAPLNLPVYYQSQSRAGYYQYVESDEIAGYARYSLWRVWTDHKLSAPKRYFGFLNMEPYVGIAADGGYINNYYEGTAVDIVTGGQLQRYTDRTPSPRWLFNYNRFTRVPTHVYYDQDEGGFFRAIPYFGLDTSFKSHRTYNFEGSYVGELMRKYLSSDNEKLRHIIEPKVRFAGSTGAGTEMGAIMGGDFGIRTAFETQRKGRSVDLGDLTFFYSGRFRTGDLFDEQTVEREYTRVANRVPTTFALTDDLRTYDPEHAFGLDLNAQPLEWLGLEADLVWDVDDISDLATANLTTHSDLSWLVQRMFASTYLPRAVRGRKDEIIVDVGYRYLKGFSNQITIGNRIWFDDFTPLLSDRLQRKTWAREMTRGWGFGFYTRLNSEESTIQAMEYTIYKNWKKCVDTAVTYRYSDDEHGIMATFWLTAYPNSKLEMGN